MTTATIETAAPAANTWLAAFDEFERVHSLWAKEPVAGRVRPLPAHWWEHIYRVLDAAFEAGAVTSEFFTPLADLAAGIFHFRNQIELGLVDPDFDEDVVDEQQVQAYERALGRIGRALAEIRAARVKGPELQPTGETLDEIATLMSPIYTEVPLRPEQGARMMGFGADVRAFLDAMKAKKMPEGIVPPHLVDFERRQEQYRRSFAVATRQWAALKSSEATAENKHDALPPLPAPKKTTAREMFDRGVSIDTICAAKSLTREEAELLIHGAAAMPADEQEPAKPKAKGKQ